MAANPASSDLDNLQQCLGLVSQIRNRSGTLWQTVAQGSSRAAADRDAAAANDASEQQQQQSNIGPPEKRFLSDLKALLDGVSSNLSDLEQRLGAQPPVGNPLPLGHSVYLCLDTSVENFPVYAGLTSTYKWMDRAHEYSGGAATLLSQNSLNR